MEVSPVRTVNSTRKRYRCSWCWDHIEKGEPCKTWFTYGENVTARMHPECFDAMHKSDLYDEELPPAGTYRRGCWCGERKEQCTCKSDNARSHDPSEAKVSVDSVVGQCEDCEGTGWYGCDGPGIPGNTEFVKCDCGTAKKCTAGWHKYRLIDGVAWCDECGLDADLSVCKLTHPLLNSQLTTEESA